MLTTPLNRPGSCDASVVPASGCAKPVRVLHVVPSLFGGGMERSLLELIRASGGPAARRLDGARPCVHAVCVLRDGDDRLIAECLSHVPIWVLSPGRRRWWTGGRWAYRRLRHVVRSWRPDVVHARTTAAWFDAAVATRTCRDVPLLLSFHGRTELRPIAWRRRLVNRWAAARARAVLAVSNDAARMLRDQWGVSRQKLHVIPNGVDLETYRPPSGSDEVRCIRRRLDLGATEHVVICVANLVPIKGIDVLLRSWRQVSTADPGARLLLVGDGPLRTELERLSMKLRCGSLVRFLGWRTDVADLLRAADLFVLPSRYEACSNAVLEAMASGLPVVATDVGGMSELVTPNRTGWLVPADAPDRLAETLLAALLHHASRRRVGQSAREAVVQHLALETCVARYASLYHELADRRPIPQVALRETAACAG